MILIRKAARSIWKGRRTYGACIVLIAIAIATYAGFTKAYLNLTQAVEVLYQKEQYGHVFAEVSGISASALRGLEGISGIEGVAGRSKTEVRIITSGENETAETTLDLHLIAWEESRGAAINQFQLVKGQLPSRGEILLSESFCQVQGFALGDRLLLVSDRKQIRATVSGMVTSSEFLARTEAEDILGSFGYMNLQDVNAFADTGNLYNEVLFRLSDGQEYVQVKPALEEALSSWGLRELYSREEESGYRNMRISIGSLASSASLIAAILIAVAALVLYVLLRRMIRQERIQVGTMKAFGLSSAKILGLYTGYGIFVGMAGWSAGYLLSVPLASWAASLFYSMFQLESAGASPSFGVLAQSFLLALTAGMVSAALAAKSVLDLHPAESMRAAVPVPSTVFMLPESLVIRFKRLFSGRFLSGSIPPSLSMVLRNIARGGGRSIFIISGITLSFTILVFMSSYVSLTEEITMARYNYSEIFDFKANLKKPASYQDAVQAAISIPETQQAEAIFETAATVQRQNLEEEITVIGLPREAKLYRLYDSKEMEYQSLPSQGAAISRSLADKMGLKKGDIIYVKTAYTGERQLPLLVSAVIGENMGLRVYLELSELCRLLEVGTTVTTILFQTDQPEALVQRLSEGNNIASVISQADLRQIEQSVMDQTNGVNVGIFAMIGLGIALAVIISTAMISLSERSREYATLLVLGMSEGTVGRIMVAEYLLLSAVAFIPGVPLSMGLRMQMVSSLSEETFSLSPYIATGHFITGSAICLLCVLLANLAAQRQIRRLDLTEVLKDRE